MKKFLLLIACVAMLFTLSSCAKTVSAIDLNRLYSVTAEICYGENTSIANLSRLGNGAWEITFTAPEALSGMTITYLNDSAEITYKGLNFSLPKENIPAAAIAETLTKALDNAASSSEVVFTAKKGKTVASGKINDNDYDLIINSETSEITGLEVADIGFDAAFSEFTLMG